MTANRKRASRKKTGASSPRSAMATESLLPQSRTTGDAGLLARALDARLRSYDDECVAERFGAEGDELFARLKAGLLELPLAAVQEAAWIARPLGGSAAQALVDAEVELRANAADHPRNQLPYDELFEDRDEDIRRAFRQKREPGEPKPLELDVIEAAMAPGGAVERALGSYEDRPEQRTLARSVAEAMSAGRHLLAEGGTGVGKSLAYLLPAALWAHRCGRPVVISTHTKTLQYQLFEKDLPLVARVAASLPDGQAFEPRTAVIKGRGNYLCLKKLLGLLRPSERELEDADRPTVISVLTWALATESGDLSDNSSFQAEATPLLRERLASHSDDCGGRKCQFFGRCFLQKQRAISMHADVVVANHALVFSELGMENSVLPPYEEIVFDEAHHVEEVATEHLVVAAKRSQTLRMLARLHRMGRSGAGTGLLADAFHELSLAEGEVPFETISTANTAVSGAAEAVRPLSEAIDDFHRQAAGLADGRGGRRRYYTKGREGRRWQETILAGRDVALRLDALAAKVEEAADAMSSEAASKRRRLREIGLDLRGQAASLSRAAEGITFLLDADQDAYVYWVEEEPSRSRQGPFGSLVAAPISVAPLLRAQLFDRKRSIVLTSATLTVAGGFDYIASRTGAGRSAEAGSPGPLELVVGSPFSYDAQARVYVTGFLPDPRSEAEHVAGLSKLLIDLFAATGGRGLALFTSYSALRAATEAAEGELRKRGVRVLAQGRDGPREHLLEELRQASGSTGVAIFGTSSFWEGVDVPGDALVALVVAKLPFHVFTEPVVQARCEALKAAGQEPFGAYTLPSAVLKLRQGFGRLIRTKQDRGVVVIADPRVHRSSYGQVFLESLPVKPTLCANVRSLVRAASDFLDGEREIVVDSEEA